MDTADWMRAVCCTLLPWQSNSCSSNFESKCSIPLAFGIRRHMLKRPPLFSPFWQAQTNSWAFLTAVRGSLKITPPSFLGVLSLWLFTTVLDCSKMSSD